MICVGNIGSIMYVYLTQNAFHLKLHSFDTFLFRVELNLIETELIDADICIQFVAYFFF